MPSGKKEERSMRISDQFMLRQVADESLVIPVGEAALKVKGLIGLSESGSLLYRRLQEGCTEEELVQALLAEYDIEHGLSLVETAAAWYHNMLNISDTAAKLHIHRNTVTYRLDLIRNKLDIDIDDMKVLQSIALSERVAARIHHS
jgi:DNA-binding PucR family transcriptional regulator